MRRSKRFLSVLLALVLCLSMLPVNALALELPALDVLEDVIAVVEEEEAVEDAEPAEVEESVEESEEPRPAEEEVYAAAEEGEAYIDLDAPVLYGSGRVAVSNTKGATGEDILAEARKWANAGATYWSASEPWPKCIAWRTGYTTDGQTSFDCCGFISRVLNDVGFRGESIVANYDCVLRDNYGAYFIDTTIAGLVNYGTDITAAVMKAKNGDYSELLPGDIIGWVDDVNLGNHIIIYAGLNSSGQPMMIEFCGSGYYERVITSDYQNAFQAGARLAEAGGADIDVIVKSGTCGDNVDWTLTESGVFTVSGTGAMTNYRGYSDRMWWLDADKITSVIIKEGVTSVGDWSFSMCDNLVEVVLSETVESIGKNAFYLSGLTSVAIPDGVTSIGWCAFGGCTNLMSVSISNSVMSIRGDAFSQTGLRNVTIPKNVMDIGSGAFSHCDNLTYIQVAKENLSYSNDQNGVLFNKDKTLLICVPGGYDGLGYTIPASVESIDEGAFYEIGITNIEIPGNVKSIGDYAFYGTDLTSTTISEGVESIGNRAFGNTGLTSVVIPASVKVITDSAFEDCEDLKHIWVEEDNESFCSDEYGGLYLKDKTAFICLPCGYLGSYIISKGATWSFSGAFRNCSKLTSVVFPDGMRYINADTFENCSSLSSVFIPTSVTDIGANAFSECNSLEDIYYYGPEEEWESITIDSTNEIYLENATIHYSYVKPGDVSGDWKVDGDDLVCLMKRVLEENGIVDHADINRDGSVDILDVIRLVRYLSGEDVELN